MATGKGTMNLVILTGRLGGDPDLKYTPTGTAVANFSMATNRVWKDKDNNLQEETDWHRIVLWRRLAEIAGEFLKKGSLITIIGRLQKRSWEDKEGIKRSITEVVAENLVMLGSKNSGQDTHHQEPGDMAARAESGGQLAPSNSQPSNDVEPPPPAEDDLPF